MKKNMYPLMLSEGVVAAIDQLAAQRGTNRSNLVNQILAEYVSYTTPEMRIDQIFSRIEELLSGVDTFQVMLRGNGSILNMRSALAFKYNPNVRYSVELYRTPGEAFGELRVSMRTQNHTLMLYLMQFFKLWAKVESAYLPGCVYAIGDGKFVRQLALRSRESVSSQELGQLICSYVAAFDEALKAFFYNLEDAQTAIAQVEQIYRNYNRSSSILI